MVRGDARSRRWLVGTVGIAFLLGGVMTLVAAPTADQRAKIAAAGRDIAAAEKSVKAGKAKQAVEPISRSQTAISELLAAGDLELKRMVDPLKKRILALRTELELEGLSLPAFKIDEASKTDPKTPDPKTPATAAGKISFVKQLAPLLVGKCGRCHVDDNKGKFSMATFATLKKGSESGVVFFPRKSQGSRIVEVIETGDMPRGGGKVSKEELTMLAKWIDEGATFDGPNENAPLKQFVTAPAAAPERPKLEVVAATGKESSSYSRDVAVVLAQHCTACHGEMQPRANLNFASFERLLAGGNTGNVMVPGKPADSLLIKKLKGMAGERMPLRQPALAADVIEKIEKWIAEGAKFDGPSPQAPTAQVAALYIAKHATHEELSARRSEQAAKNWRLAIPGAENKPTVLETDDLLLYGRVGDKTLEDVSQRAVKQAAKVASILKAPAGKPLVKGRLTLFVFNQRYDYSEFGQMVEKRPVPGGWQGHWGYNVIDAYACVLIPKTDEYSLDVLVAQQLAGVYIASQGAGVPRWFAEGSARAVAASVDSRDARVKHWESLVPSVAASSPRPDAFITGGLSPEEADVLSYGFARQQLKPGSRSFQKLLEALRAGEPFDRAFASAYRATPVQLAGVWIRTAVRRR